MPTPAPTNAPTPDPGAACASFLVCFLNLLRKTKTVSFHVQLRRVVINVPTACQQHRVHVCGVKIQLCLVCIGINRINANNTHSSFIHTGDGDCQESSATCTPPYTTRTNADTGQCPTAAPTPSPTPKVDSVLLMLLSLNWSHLFQPTPIPPTPVPPTPKPTTPAPTPNVCNRNYFF